MNAAVELKDLTKQFGTRTAVNRLCLTVGQGEVLALLGQNGAGKTTTIRMLSGLTMPTSGDAFLMGHSICSDLAGVKQVINVSPQETAVAPRLSVRENLELMARFYGADRETARKKAAAQMEKFHLEERAEDRAGKLSGGMQRRLSIAMALISEPKVLFLDEPTLGLDVRARRDLWGHIEALRGSVTVILTTHYLEEAEALADRIAILDGGKLRAVGTVGQLKQQTGLSSLEDVFLSMTEEVEAS